MVPNFHWKGLMLLLGFSPLPAVEPDMDPGPADQAVKITIIYDNYQGQKNLETDWGFACAVECRGEKLLFDAGQKEALYRRNAELLRVRPEAYPALFISHLHGDHTGGMAWILDSNPAIMCYLPSDFALTLKSMGRLPAKCLSISEPVWLFGPFYSTGDDFDKFSEQGLVIKTEDGGVLITGCGHPGVVEMVTKTKEELGIELHTVIGGLHLLRTSDEDVKKIAEELKQLGIRRICPTHCTGDRVIELMKVSFGEGYIAGGTGTEIVIK